MSQIATFRASWLSQTASGFCLSAPVIHRSVSSHVLVSHSSLQYLSHHSQVDSWALWQAGESVFPHPSCPFSCRVPGGLSLPTSPHLVFPGKGQFTATPLPSRTAKGQDAPVCFRECPGSGQAPLWGMCVAKIMELLFVGLASCCKDDFQDGWSGD